MKTKKKKRIEKELPAKMDDGSFVYSSDNIKDWEKQGLIPKELANANLEQIEQSLKQVAQYKEFKNNNPNATYEEECAFWNVSRQLTDEECSQHKLRAQTTFEMHEFLTQNWDYLSISDLQEEEPVSFKPDLFPGIDSSKYFGLASGEQNIVYHLEHLIANAKCENRGPNSWEAVGTFQKNTEETLKIRYQFETTTQEEADRIVANFKNIMLEDGLRVWLACWKVANVKRGVSCKCSFIEPMKYMYNRTYKPYKNKANPHKITKRKSTFFSEKEKAKQWRVMQMLKRVYLSVERTVEKAKTTKRITQWIEQPFLTIPGGEGTADSKKYPKSITFNVLLAGNHTDKFYPAIYDNEILLQPANTTLLNFLIQGRTSQSYYGNTAAGKDVKTRQFWPWESIFKYYNMEKAAEKFPRQTKARAKERINKSVVRPGISCEFTDDGVWVTTDITRYKKREQEIKRLKREEIKI